MFAVPVPRGGLREHARGDAGERGSGREAQEEGEGERGGVHKREPPLVQEFAVSTRLVAEIRVIVVTTGITHHQAVLITSWNP